jgi:Fur family transcriptional regulator, iron response regulator
MVINPTQSSDIPRFLRSHGVTPTAQRVGIARVIFARPQHFSADQLLTEANRGGRSVSKATIYNTLDLFVRKGLVRELIIDSARVFYDSTTHPHHHFYDPVNQQLYDVETSDVEVKLPSQIPHGMEISNVDVIIHLRQPRGDEVARG